MHEPHHLVEHETVSHTWASVWPPLLLAASGVGMTVAAWILIGTWETVGVGPLSVFARLIVVLLTIRGLVHAIALIRIVVLAVGFRLRLDLSPTCLQVVAHGPSTRIERDQVLGFAVDERRRRPAWGHPLPSVLVLCRPTIHGAGPVTVLPGIFDRNVRSLAERLMRWRGPTKPSIRESGTNTPASARYERAADLVRGHTTRNLDEETIAVRHGRMWLTYGPFGTLALGAALIPSWLDSGALTQSIVPCLFLLALCAIPMIWLLLVRRQLTPRLGLSMVLDQHGLLLRGPNGTVEVGWGDIERALTQKRWSWALLHGVFAKRTLVLIRRDGPAIRYDEAYLGLPLEAATELILSYQRRFAVSGGSASPEAQLAL